MNSSSNGQMKSAHIVATDVFSSALLRYHCSDAFVAMSQKLVAAMTYGPLPQCLFIVVYGRLLIGLLVGPWIQ
jgi:hypothetical protein